MDSKIETGGKLLAEGTAEKPVRLARYDLVQEGANTNWSDTAFTSHAYFGSSSSPKPEGRFSFVEWYPAGLYANSGQSDSISFKNNIFFGGNITTVEPILRFTNCFFDRITMLYEFPQELTIQSCTFRRSLVEIFESGTNRIIRNTFFDETDVWGSSDILHSHNAYRAGFNHLTPTNVSDVFLLSAMPYANGTFGRYYQAATNLVDRGSGLASSFGLYHFTSQSSEAKEENSTVDIGFHYVAASEYGEIPKSTMTASASSTFSGWDAANAIDGEIIDPGWHNSSQTEEPAWLRIDLGTVRSIARIGYIAREVNGNPYDYSGRYKQYKYYVTTNSTTNPVNWGTPA